VAFGVPVDIWCSPGSYIVHRNSEVLRGNRDEGVGYQCLYKQAAETVVKVTGGSLRRLDVDLVGLEVIDGADRCRGRKVR
jgi:hypothetical protein